MRSRPPQGMMSGHPTTGPTDLRNLMGTGPGLRQGLVVLGLVGGSMRPTPWVWLAAIAATAASFIHEVPNVTGLSKPSRKRNPLNMVVERGLQPKKEGAYTSASRDLGSPAVILVNPFLDENIGSVARAMMNYGLTDLRLVGPQCDHLSPAARARSAGADQLLENARVFGALDEAAADLEGLIATTARQRDMTLRVVSPEEAASLATGTPETFAEGTRRYGYLFGSERNGLKNEHLVFATAILSIPTFPSFSSLNLAQAVHIVGYEYWKARCRLGDGAYSYKDSSVPTAKGTRLASVGEVQGLWQRIQDVLDATFENPDKQARAAIYARFQNILVRSNMDTRDVSSIHGVVSAIIRNHARLEPMRIENELRDKDGTRKQNRPGPKQGSRQQESGDESPE